MDPLERACGLKLMLAFEGREAGFHLVDMVQRRPIAGVTLFRAANIESPAQVRRLTAALQAAAAVPLLIATDQEGGQLIAVEGATPFPGNMALGAAGSADLARRTGAAIGRELAAMGINVNYAPVCDVNNNPHNPVIGVRSFGEEPAAVARFGAAMVEGLQSSGVAATAKHFPGHGDTRGDSHHGLPVVDHDRGRLAQIELPPFAAAIGAGVRLVMTAHVALPRFNGGAVLPATLSQPLLTGLLRQEMGLKGVIISDAMDMAAIAQGPGMIADLLAAVAAGVDLLLCTDAPPGRAKIEAALLHAVRRRQLPSEQLLASAERVLALQQWLAGQPQPPLEAVGCAEHRALAFEVAARSITLVRDDAGLLPLRLGPAARLAVVVPQPADLTPADTSSHVTCKLAEALRRCHPAVDEWVVPHVPSAADIAAIVPQVHSYDLAVVGTINAFAQPQQAALVNALLAAGVPTVAVAMRLPYDLQAYPAAPTYLCAYSILEPSMDALAAALFGQIRCQGRLPVSIPGLYPLGHGLVA